MEKGICHIVGAGDFSPELVNISSGDIVIACDGGYSALKSHGIRCDICIGDFDSLGYVPDFPETVVLPTVKDVTDMEAGIGLGLEKGYKDFRLYGALGGKRLSHSVANIQTAAGLAKKGSSCIIMDADCDIVAICDGESVFERNNYSFVSVFAIGGSAKVQLEGFRYGDGESIILEPTYPLGVSNEFVANEGRIKVEGSAVIIFEKI